MNVPAVRNSPASVLVVRLGAMGDVIHTLHAVTALRAAFPEIRIGWLIEERWSELLCAKSTRRSGARDASRPVADLVHPVNTKRWRTSLFSGQTRREAAASLHALRSAHYECAVDFQGAIKSAILARLSHATSIFGFQHPREAPAKFFYRRRIATAATHVVDQYRDLAEAVAGRTLPQVPPVLPRDEHAEKAVELRLREVRRDFVLINPGAGWRAKQWPAERYGQVARVLSQHYLGVVINFGPGEESLAASVRNASGGAAVLFPCSIPELIALTRRARLFIGGDTGPLHLAAALQIPVVGIFGPTDPARNGPYSTKSIVVRNPASPNSLSHTNRPDPGLQQITSDEVLNATCRLLEETRA